MEKIINLTSSEYKDLQSYCKLNKLNEDDIIKSSYLQGIKIEMYGLLSGGNDVVVKEVEKIVEKRVEIPVEVIKEVVKVEYVEVPVEVIKEIVKVEKVEVPVEVIKEVEKIVEVEKFSTNTTEINEINEKFSTKIEEMENIFHKEKDELLKKIYELENKPPVENVEDNNLKNKLEAIQKTVQKLRGEVLDKDREIENLKKTIDDIQKMQENKKAVYLNGSNLDNKLYK